MHRRVFVSLAVIMLGWILVAGCRQVTSTEPLPTSSYPTVTLAPRVAAPTAGQNNGEIPRIAPDEVWERLQAGEAITILDARSAGEYQTEHIAGAISLPAAEVEQRWGELPRDRLLVFYCT
jgi:hypothetical protein